MNKGFMFLHRQLLDWEWFDNSNMVHVWIYLLLKANYQDDNWHGIKIPRGSLLTSVNAISKSTGLSTQNVRTCLSKLKLTGEITIKVTNLNSIITICKYNDYNIYDIDTNKQTNKRSNEQINKPLTTENNNNNNNKDNKEIKEEDTNVSKKKPSNELEEEFDAFRLKYKEFGGKARGFETEFENFKKKHQDWKEVIPILGFALEKENAERVQAIASGGFFPQMKNLQTYLNQRSWEAYFDGSEKQDPNEYHPLTDGMFQVWMEKEKYLRFDGQINSLNDGYTADNRPDGATVGWQMYRWVWSKEQKRWNKK